MSRAPDDHRWADRQREERAFTAWRSKKLAAARDHLRATQRVVTGKTTEPVEISDRGVVQRLAVRLSDERAMVWTAPRGFHVVELSAEPLLKARLDFDRMAFELAAVTRRAFVPGVVTQIYQTHPLLQLLSNGLSAPRRRAAGNGRSTP